MTIYNIFEYYEREMGETVLKTKGPKINPEAFASNHIAENFIPESTSKRQQIFSAIAARFFFFLLLIADVVWGVYSIVALSIKLTLNLLTLGRVSFLRKTTAKSWLSVKRSIVCGIALFIALFSPALGIMFSCMYFLMYDKNGVDEVVPSSLRDQFKEIFPS